MSAKETRQVDNKSTVDDRDIFNREGGQSGRQWTESVHDSTETIDDSVVVPIIKSAAGTKSIEVDGNESDDDDSNSSTVVAGDADDELTPSPGGGAKRRHKTNTKDSLSEDTECRAIAEMVKEMMKTKTPGKVTGQSDVDPLPAVEVQSVDYSTKTSNNSKAGGKNNDTMEVGMQKNRLVSAMFAEIKGNSPSSADGSGSSRVREDSVFGPSAKAPMAASAAMVTGLKKWQIRSKSSDVTNAFTKHPTHMADIRENWNEERKRLPFPIMLQIQREVEPILQNIVRTYKSAMGAKHKLTLQAIDKLEKLKVQIHGDGVYT